MNCPAANYGVSRIKKPEFRRQNKRPYKRFSHQPYSSDSWLLDALKDMTHSMAL
jgi:hypothetical protein